jgi:hypothetical protein
LWVSAKFKSRSRASEAVPHKADAISEERKWVDLKDTSSGAGDALTDGDGRKDSKDRKFEIREENTEQPRHHR